MTNGEYLFVDGDQSSLRDGSLDCLLTKSERAQLAA
jgi:hypothetical protein